MLLTFRLAGLSALEAHYAAVTGRTQSGALTQIALAFGSADSQRLGYAPRDRTELGVAVVSLRRARPIPFAPPPRTPAR
jgi:hypothetical protein